ncbi:phosphotransferase family protein [Paenibacillus hodogayensis]|uniref:Phosphotransferase family protein n=1 Tax=Paenibacillus hodogayensis TaxID=279208 RepID=A0ABV5W606_9BACL
MVPISKTLSDHTLEWVVDAVDPEASVLAVEQLQGGVSSRVHAVVLRSHGDKRAVVVREFDNADWVREQPDLALQEAQSLRRASQAGEVPTPALIACDQSGSECGMPVVVMTRLEGRVVLEPPDRALWLDGMAEALARLHTIEAGDHPWTFAPYSNAATLDTTSWSKVPDLWRKAADIVTGTRPRAAMRFIHRDYHPANVLWHAGKVSGVVDWVNGCVGPVGIDVGHCRVNLAQLHGIGAADEFLACYENHAGASFAYDPYWDLVTLIDFAYERPEVYGGWTALGMTGLTAETVMESLDRYLVSLLNRMST